jgi:hypothetical protein
MRSNREVQPSAPALARAVTALATVALLAGHAAAAAASPAGALTARSIRTMPAAAAFPWRGGREAGRMHRQNACTPSVWASELQSSPPQVIGYSGGTPCVAIDGSSSGTPFLDPYGLATDANGYLYVADAKNGRVVVFDNQGNYWSTLRASGAPFGVCVSSTGVVGVANNFTPGTVDFFTNKGAQSSVQAPTNTLSGTNHPNQTAFCAFDRRGDFFAGNPYGTPISYLRNYNVNVPGATLQTCSVLACNNNNSWTGMYSHIRALSAPNTLSVADENALNIVNFKIGLGPPNLLTFTPWATAPITALTAYPSTSICGAAPSAGQGPASRIYLSDCGANVENVANVTTGGLVGFFNAVSTGWGVATYPTGQY